MGHSVYRNVYPYVPFVGVFYRLSQLLKGKLSAAALIPNISDARYTASAPYRMADLIFSKFPAGQSNSFIVYLSYCFSKANLFSPFLRKYIWIATHIPAFNKVTAIAPIIKLINDKITTIPDINIAQTIPPNIEPNMAKPCFTATFSFCQSNLGKSKPRSIPKYAKKAEVTTEDTRSNIEFITEILNPMERIREQIMIKGVDIIIWELTFARSA